MAFQEIKPIQTTDEYIDAAIRKANKIISLRKYQGDPFNRQKSQELKRIELIKDNLIDKLHFMLDEFPKITELTPFYKEMLQATMGLDAYKIVMGRLKTSTTYLRKFYKNYHRKIAQSRDKRQMLQAKRAYYGRVCSVIKKIDVRFLKEARKAIQSFPIIKQKYIQVAITGFPNVGKSTLLSKISGSTPEIASYAFTTKGIMIGYTKNAQLLDTPGTLNRKDKMNYIEMMAFLVLKHVAEKIIYVFDITEPYPLKDQIKLLKSINQFKKPIILYLSKADILPKEDVAEFKKKFDVITDSKKLSKEISKWKKTSLQE